MHFHLKEKALSLPRLVARFTRLTPLVSFGGFSPRAHLHLAPRLKTNLSTHYNITQERHFLQAINDLVSMPERGIMKEPFDRYEMEEFEPSASMQLDTVGMQPHSREFLERSMSCKRSDFKFMHVTGQVAMYDEGIQFTDLP